jgi:hypothetical protein
VDVPSNSSFQGAVRTAFVPTAEAAAVLNGAKAPEPLVLHVAAGECITVHFTNQSGNHFASFHVGKLLRDPASSGINVGFTPEQTVAQGQSRDYVLYADSDQLGSAVISDFGGDDTGKTGLYGAMVVAPAGATFTDPVTGAPRDVGSQVDVHVPHAPGYRDFTLAFSDNDPEIGQSHMPYPTVVQKPALVNYQSAPRPTDTGTAFSSQGSGNPPTPLLRAYAGDAVQVHALVAPGSEQMHVFNLGGFSWNLDPRLTNDSAVQSRGIGAWETVDAAIIGGAGGPAHATGDFFYGDLRRPFTQAGMWGLLRVLPPGGSGGPIKPLDAPALHQPAPSAAAPTTRAPATSTSTALLVATATALAMTRTATHGRDARPRPSVPKTAPPAPRREQPSVTVRVPRGIILHGAPVIVRVRTRPGADARITLRLTRQGTRCTGAARQRVCGSVTVVLSQRVMHVRANRHGLVTRSVQLSYSPASPLRATLGVRVWTRYGAVTRAAVVLLQPTPGSRQR